MRNHTLNFKVKEYSNLIVNLTYTTMKRYPNTTILASLMLVMVSAIGLLTLVSFKHKAPRFKVPVIISKNGTSICLATKSAKKAIHRIERVEKFGDTLNMCKNNSPEKYYEFTCATIAQPSYINNMGLKIIVDTMHTLNKESLISNVGFPVYIINQSSNKTLSVETKKNNLIMVMEALSTKNTWEPIEYVSESTATKDYMSIHVPPHHYLFTSSIKYNGEYTTKCRIKLINNKEAFYSNEFYMGVDLAQFANI